ncbi:hypothetical protein [uncultured Methanospirillum sp.]|nr:hypothetical protein [uncultured Methanospirillum sp.]
MQPVATVKTILRDETAACNDNQILKDYERSEPDATIESDSCE